MEVNIENIFYLKLFQIFVIKIFVLNLDNINISIDYLLIFATDHIFGDSIDQVFHILYDYVDISQR